MRDVAVCKGRWFRLVTVIFGAEPYLIDKKVEELGGMDREIIDSLSEELVDSWSGPSLFGEKTGCFIVELTTAQLTKQKHLINNVKALSVHLICKVTDGDPSSISNENQWSLMKFDRVNQSKLLKFIGSVAAASGSSISQEVASLLIDRTGYLVVDTVSLYDVLTAVRELSAVSPEGIQLAAIQDIDAPAETDVFFISKADARMRPDERKRLLFSLDALVERHGGMALLGNLARTFRLMYKVKLLGALNDRETASCIGISEYALRYYRTSRDVNTIKHCLDAITGGISQIKNGDLTEEEAVHLAVTQILKS